MTKRPTIPFSSGTGTFRPVAYKPVINCFVIGAVAQWDFFIMGGE